MAGKLGNSIESVTIKVHVVAQESPWPALITDDMLTLHILSGMNCIITAWT
jgi:hypothetical protein